MGNVKSFTWKNKCFTWNIFQAVKTAINAYFGMFLVRMDIELELFCRGKKIELGQKKSRQNGV